MENLSGATGDPLRRAATANFRGDYTGKGRGHWCRSGSEARSKREPRVRVRVRVKVRLALTEVCSVSIRESRVAKKVHRIT